MANLSPKTAAQRELLDWAHRLIDGTQKQSRGHEEWYEVGWYEFEGLRDALKAVDDEMAQ